jgi:excisionase family DNA binding protein
VARPGAVARPELLRCRSRPAPAQHAQRPRALGPDRPVLTPAGAASLLGVREVDVLELAEHEELPGRRVAGQWRFARERLIAWVAGVDR